MAALANVVGQGLYGGVEANANKRSEHAIWLVADFSSRPGCRLSDLDSGHHFFGCRHDLNCPVPPMRNDASARLGHTGRWPRVEGAWLLSREPDRTVLGQTTV